MQIHMRGVELVIELLEAADRIETTDPKDLEALLRETSYILGQVLARDAQGLASGEEKQE